MVREAGPEVAQGVREHEPGDASSRVDRGEDEQRLEHDREVVPEAHHGLTTEELMHDRREAYGEGWCATGTADD